MHFPSAPHLALSPGQTQPGVAVQLVGLHRSCICAGKERSSGKVSGRGST